MMFSSTTCRFLACFLSLSLSATAETIRGAERKLADVVNLGTAENYAILTKTGISTTLGTTIKGNIAVSPIAATAMTGFSLVLDSGGELSTAAQVDGQAFAASYLAPTPAILVSAIADMEAAYTDAAGRAQGTGDRLNLGDGDISERTLTPGVYTFGKQVDVSFNKDITFNGTATDIFIIQTTGSVRLGSGAKVTLTGGAKAENIFWQVAGFVELGTTAHMEGILLVKTHVIFKTGSSLNGRILSQTACTLDKATITQQPAVTSAVII
jgi:hypothetical protein